MIVVFGTKKSSKLCIPVLKRVTSCVYQSSWLVYPCVELSLFAPVQGVYVRTYTLQKQVGCFNHRVVTLVADKLERQWLREVYFGMED